MEYHATAIAWYSTGGYCQKAKPPTNIPRTLWEYRHSRKFFECQYCPKIATTIVHSWQQGAKWFYDEIENDKIASVHRLLSQYSLLAGKGSGGINVKSKWCNLQRVHIGDIKLKGTIESEEQKIKWYLEVINNLKIRTVCG